MYLYRLDLATDLYKKLSMKANSFREPLVDFK
jgi:hypothetical protein